MIELIKLIVDIASKAISSLGKRRDDRQMGEIGSELFLFYIQVNEALLIVSDIVSSLEIYVERMSDHLATGKDPYALTGGHWIKYKAQVQRANLARIGETVQRWGPELQIIDGKAFAQIAPLLRGKSNALDVLLNALSRDRLPISAGWEQLLALTTGEDTSDRREMRRQIAIKVENFSQSVNDATIPLDTPWDQEIYEQIKLYLELRNPRAQLNEIKDALESIHAALERTFSIKDILLRVGDKRFDLHYNGEYFW